MQTFLVLLLCWVIFTSASGQNVCGPNHWQCADTTCIYHLSRCNNFPDCPDGSDEEGCTPVPCNEGQRACTSGGCIDEILFCDGNINCLDASDETAPECAGPEPETSSAAPITEAPVQVGRTEWPTWVRPWEVKTPAPQTSTTPFNTLPTKVIALNTWFPPETTAAPKQVTTISTRPLPVQGANNNRLWIPPLRGTTLEPTTSKQTVTDQYWINATTPKNPCKQIDDPFEFCRRRYRGYFRHPEDCKQYVVCEWGFLHICQCPEWTTWDQNLLTCAWHSECVIDPFGKPILPDVRSGEETPVPRIVKERGTQKPKQSPTISATTTTDFIPPQILLRGLPSTPAWLRELSEKSFIAPQEPVPPRFQSLLTRFFKPEPLAPNRAI